MAERKKKNSELPQTEKQLKELQALFMENKANRKVRDEFILLLRQYARSLTLKEIKRKGIFLDPWRVDEIATDATLQLFRQYNKDGWQVFASFGGALKWKIFNAMYAPAQEEINLKSSLNGTFSEEKDSKEILDIVSHGACLPWDYERGDNATMSYDPSNTIRDSIDVSTDEIKSVIDEAYRILPYPTYMRFLPWLLLQFRKPKTRNIQELFNSLFISNREESAFDILLLEIHNRIAQHAY